MSSIRRRSVLLSVVCLLLSASTLASQPRVAANLALSLTAKLQACGAGYYVNAGGACTPAPPGTYSTGGTSTFPIPCAPGAYQPDDRQSSCIVAPAGSYVAGARATSATLCPTGFYQPNTGSISCIAASPGFYATGPGATSVVPIPPLAGYDALISAARTTPGVAPGEAAKLVNGRRNLVARNQSHACGAETVNSFVSYVRRESGRKISTANAQMLLSKSREAKNALRC